MTKRLFDLVASSIGLILLSPVMAVISVAVRLDSRGPVIFRQKRIGRGGRPFTLLKFRSMSTSQAQAAPLVTVAADARITRVGAKLRATKLDELPQLINVLRGEMSIVGPRPEVAKYVAMWSEEDRRIILSVRPGITDPATVLLRREEQILAEQPDPEAFYQQDLLPQKTRVYRQYVESASFSTDLGLILRTISSVMTG